MTKKSSQTFANLDELTPHIWLLVTISGKNQFLKILKLQKSHRNLCQMALSSIT